MKAFISGRCIRGKDNAVSARLARDEEGAFLIAAAVGMFVLLIAVGTAIDFALALNEHAKMQQALDAAVLGAVQVSGIENQKEAAEHIFQANFDAGGIDFDSNLTLTANADKSVTAIMRFHSETAFMGLLGIDSVPLSVKASAIAVATSTPGPCIIALGSTGQDVLINSGASVTSTGCSFHVHSTANPAFIMNSGSTIALADFCVKGTNYIKNGGTLNNMHTGCSVQADPYAGALPEPTVPATCTTSGYFNDSAVTLEPGMHCGTGFNGSPTITFKPGLHIIKGTMIINSGATVIANGVTFYFPDVWSELRANGALKFTGIAPTTGTYKGILMFEKTSDPSNNAYKSQYIFNGSNGETLEGIIHLPNRNVTYNSTTNVTAKISLVVNQMILNSSNWKVEPYTGAGVSSTAKGARLTE